MPRVYYLEDGTVDYVMNAPSEQFYDEPEYGCIDVSHEVDAGNYYVDVTTSPHGVKFKKVLKTPYVVDGLTVSFTSLPADTHVYIEGMTTSVGDEGDLEIDFDLPGAYRFLFTCEPMYGEEHVEVVVGQTDG